MLVRAVARHAGARSCVASIASIPPFSQCDIEIFGLQRLAGSLKVVSGYKIIAEVAPTCGSPFTRNRIKQCVLDTAQQEQLPGESLRVISELVPKISTRNLHEKGDISASDLCAWA